VITIDSPVTESPAMRQVFGCFPSGVAAVCCVVDDTPVGMAVSSFTSVSLAPPLVSVCIQQTSATWPKLRHRPRLGLSVLAEDQEAACRALSSKDGDRFAGVGWQASPDGALFIHGAVGWFDCTLHAELAAGDHTIALLEIRRAGTAPDAAPLVFHGSRYRRLAEVHRGVRS